MRKPPASPGSRTTGAPSLPRKATIGSAPCRHQSSSRLTALTRSPEARAMARTGSGLTPRDQSGGAFTAIPVRIPSSRQAARTGSSVGLATHRVASPMRCREVCACARVASSAASRSARRRARSCSRPAARSAAAQVIACCTHARPDTSSLGGTSSLRRTTPPPDSWTVVLNAAPKGVGTGAGCACPPTARTASLVSSGRSHARPRGALRTCPTARVTTSPGETARRGPRASRAEPVAESHPCRPSSSVGLAPRDATHSSSSSRATASTPTAVNRQVWPSVCAGAAPRRRVPGPADARKDRRPGRPRSSVGTTKRSTSPLVRNHACPGWSSTRGSLATRRCADAPGATGTSVAVRVLTPPSPAARSVRPPARARRGSPAGPPVPPRRRRSRRSRGPC